MSAAACPSGTVPCHNQHAQRMTAKGRKRSNGKLLKFQTSSVAMGAAGQLP
jgi:hypothetical protein